MRCSKTSFPRTALSFQSPAFPRLETLHFKITAKPPIAEFVLRLMENLRNSACWEHFKQARLHVIYYAGSDASRASDAERLAGVDRLHVGVLETDPWLLHFLNHSRNDLWDTWDTPHIP